ncbi:ABC transporter substrate-binding protein [Rhodococcus globerulus]|uniref:ABC transporter substrate-binding protein n=1 Tax=Rhodococcus globerulus TaxID=33008 RepID=UPI0022786B88|nr:ABC transporter substrate-binding protein [Rhodococcus globerulus]MCE4267257.1 ABC transporter substrate-binding protein [Rhodococcus globerulus]
MALSAGAALTLLLSSCSSDSTATPSDQAGEPQRGGTLAYSYNTDAQSVDPVTCAIGIGLAPCQAVYGALLYYDLVSGEITPGMAESFSSEDGKVWTLALRPGLTFTDGTPFNAESVAFNWQRTLDPKLLSPSMAAAKTISWSVVDDTTLTVTSNEVNHQLPFMLTESLAFVGSPTAITQKGADFGNSPVGAGPFVMTSWARGTEMVLDRNPGYWDQPRPYVDRVVVKTIPADDQRFNALQSGDVNVMMVNGSKYPSRAKSAGMDLVQSNLLGGQGVRLSSRGALADPAVRAAVGKLIDNDQIMAAVYPDDPVATHFIPEGSPLHDVSATWPAKDVAGAQKLIDEYRASNGGGNVVLSYVTTAGSPALTQVAELLQAQLEQVDGLKLEIKPLDGAGFASALTSGNFDLILNALGGAHPDNLYRTFHTEGSGNTAGYSDPIVDQALEMTHSSNDQAVVKEAYQTAIRQIVDTTAYRFWRPAVATLITPKSVHGVEAAYQYWFRPELAWVQK